MKRFLKTAFTYFIGNVLSKLVTFFLIPLYTNKLVPSEYGQYDLTITIVTLLVSVAFFQVWDGMYRLSFDVLDEENKYKVIGDAFMLYLLCIPIYTFVYLGADLFLNLSNFFWVYVYGICLGLQYQYSYIARVFLDNRLFVVSGTINAVVTAALNVILILFFAFGVESLYIAQIVGCVVQIFIIEQKCNVCVNIRKNKFNKNSAKKIFSFSMPLCIATVSYWLLNGYTKTIINNVLGAYENGIYAIANSLSNVAVLTINVFQFAWNEMAYMMSGDDNRKKVYKKCIDLLFFTVFIGCAVICLVVKMIFPYLVGADYKAASEIIPILMVGVCANAVAGFVGTIFMTEKNTKVILFSTIISAIFNILFSFWFTNWWGIVGAVICLSLSFIILMLVRFFLLKKIVGISLSIMYIFSCVPVVLSILLYRYVDSWYIYILFISMLIVLYVVAIQKFFGFKIQWRVNGGK